MARYILLVFSLLFTLVAEARTIQGIVLSSNDSTALVGASCRLLSEGKFLSGTSTALTVRLPCRLMSGHP